MALHTIGATLLFSKFICELLNRKMAPGFNILDDIVTLYI